MELLYSLSCRGRCKHKRHLEVMQKANHCSTQHWYFRINAVNNCPSASDLSLCLNILFYWVFILFLFNLKTNKKTKTIRLAITTISVPLSLLHDLYNITFYTHCSLTTSHWLTSTLCTLFWNTSHKYLRTHCFISSIFIFFPSIFLYFFTYFYFFAHTCVLCKLSDN